MVPRIGSEKLTRRRREPDPLASRAAVQDVLGRLRAALPKLVPAADRDVIALLRAARHAERSPDVRPGRRRTGRWRRDQLQDVLRVIAPLLKEASPNRRISPATFINHYLRILRFPIDITRALERSDVTLFEASQLARLTPERLGMLSGEARVRREEILEAHLLSDGSSDRLRRRVDAAIARVSGNVVEPNDGSGESFDDGDDEGDYLSSLLEGTAELDEELRSFADQAADARHLFYEHLLAILHALSDVSPDDFRQLPEAERGRLFEHGDKIILTLQSLKRVVKRGM